MKKVYCKILCFVFIATLLFAQFTSLNSKALNVATVSVTKTSGQRSDIVNISVKITNNSKMQACGLTLLYDNNVLEVLSVEKGSILSGSPVINTSKLGKIVFSYAATSPLTAGGSLLNVAFMIKSNATFGESKITCNLTELSDGDFNNLDANVIEGQVVVIAPALDAPNQIDVINCGDTSVELLWEGNEYATGYNIYIDDTLYNDVPYTDNTVKIQNLSPDTEYQIQISTLNYLTESDKSSVITAKTTKPKCFVVFYSWDETILDVQEVEYGSFAIAPVPAYREGYHFLGWNEPFDYITDYKEIQPLYEKNVCSHENTEVRSASGSACTVAGYTGDTYCLDCGELITSGTVIPATGHNFDIAWKSNDTVHWHECTVCGEESDKANHLYDNDRDASCNLCGYTREVRPVDENDPQLVIESTKTAPGKEVAVAVDLSKNPGLAYLKLELNYDDAALELVSATNAQLLLGTYTTSKTIDTKPYVLQWMGADDSTGSGEIAVLIFRVKDNAEDGDYTVSLNVSEAYNADFEDVAIAVQDGTITVQSVIIGDFNGDGKINGKDGILCSQALAGWDVEYFELAADVNGDGKFNGKDGILLSQYLAGWDVVLG